MICFSYCVVSFFLRRSFSGRALWAKWDDHTLGHGFTLLSFPVFEDFFIGILVTFLHSFTMINLSCGDYFCCQSAFHPCHYGEYPSRINEVRAHEIYPQRRVTGTDLPPILAQATVCSIKYISQWILELAREFLPNHLDTKDCE